MAPEALMRQQYSRKSDVFSFGVVQLIYYQDCNVKEQNQVVYEIVTCSDPWPDYTPMEAAHEVITGNTMEIPECPNVFQLMMKLCWSYNPRDRPDFTDLLELIKSTEEEEENSENIDEGEEQLKLTTPLKSSDYNLSASLFKEDFV